MYKDENIVERLTKFILQNDLKQSQIDEFITENKDELQTITELSFRDGRNIGCEGVKALAPILEYTNITYLDISDNGIRSAGAVALADVLKDTSLNKISFHQNNIQYTGLATLIDSTKDTYITSINLTFYYRSGLDFNILYPLTKKLNEQMTDVLLNNRMSANINFQELILKNEYSRYDKENTKNLLSKYQCYGKDALKPSKHALAENDISIENKFTDIDESIKKYFLDILSESSRKCYMPPDLQSIVSGYCNDTLPRFDLSPDTAFDENDIEIVGESSSLISSILSMCSIS